MSDPILCAGCGNELNPDDAFCSSCGQVREDIWSDLSGWVDRGRWHRAPGDLARRIALEDMRRSLGRASVDVPPGTLGLVVVDGIVEEILRPGLRTTIGWLDRLTGLFTGRLERMGFYLVDLRPLPIPMRLQVQRGQKAVEMLATVVAEVDRGSKERLGTFLDQIVRERDSVGQRELEEHLAMPARQLLRDLLKPGISDGIDALDALGSQARAQLQAQLGDRLGLQVDLRLELVPLATLELSLGRARVPARRACSADGCDALLPPGLDFCSTCGAGQPPAGRACNGCGSTVEADNAFCTNCGEAWVEPAPEARALFSAEGRALEIDLALRITGHTDDAALEGVGRATAAALARLLRERRYDDLASPAGFDELSTALAAALEEAMPALGGKLRDVVLLDLREVDGDWLLGARSQLEQRRRELLAGREWLEADTEALDLEQAAFGVVLARLRAETDQDFARRETRLEARARATTLDQREADLDVADAELVAQRDIGLDAAERSSARAGEAADHDDRMSAIGRTAETESVQLGHEIDLEKTATDHARATELSAAELESAKRRIVSGDKMDEARVQMELDLERASDEQRLQLEKLRAMSDLDREIADADHARELEAKQADHGHEKDLAASGLSAAQLLAVQASRLADSEHGDAAFEAIGEAEAAAAGTDHAERLAEQAERHADRMADVIDSQQQSLSAAVSGQARSAAAATESATRMAEAGLEGLGAKAAAEATPAPVVAAVGGEVREVDCKECGHRIEPPYKFCGRCGVEQ